MPTDKLPPVIAVVRMQTTEEAAAVCAGLSRIPGLGIEVTMTTPGALGLIRELSSTGAAVGAGTVTTPGQVDEVRAAGARFIVAPNTDPAVLEQARRHRLPSVPGALTPTEIARAHVLGAAAVKIFPVGSVGGPSYIRAVREPLPEVDLVVSGGISIDAVPEYFQAGCAAVCLGRALINMTAAREADPGLIAQFALAQLRSVGIDPENGRELSQSPDGLKL
jgi:2-dehydro-3-deoxyphosphogluconate aldolase/(4S)-4-hydroxy-2-oxoglutarate aldolase